MMRRVFSLRGQHVAIVLGVIAVTPTAACAQVFEVTGATYHQIGAAAPPAPARPSASVPMAAARAAERHDLAPALVDAVIRRESGYRPKGRSRAGALGLMQLMPATARRLGVDPLDPLANLEGGSTYLRMQLDRFGGHVDLALAAYNAGPSAVQHYGKVPPFRETQAYVAASLDRLADISLALPKPDLRSMP